MWRAEVTQNSSTRGLKALLIEDNESDYLLIRSFLMLLPKRSISLDWVSTSALGLKSMTANEHDIYLLDYRLGPDDGLEILEQAIKAGCKKPIIFLTGFDQYEVDVEAMHRGAVDFLVKAKIDAASLERSMRYAIENWRAKEYLNSSLLEKEVMLREIHHRVKNNLQVISSLLKLQRRKMHGEEARKTLHDCYTRVQSISLIHDKLYHSQELSSINFSEYIRVLAEELFRSYGVSSQLISLQFEVEEVKLSVNLAIPCGLLINELISNALKHAFPNRLTGQIILTFKRLEDDRFLLGVSDNGVGMPKELETVRHDSLGLELIHTLANQLGGDLKISNQNGAQFLIIFSDQ